MGDAVKARKDLIYWMPPGTAWVGVLEWVKDHAQHELRAEVIREALPGGPNHLVIECQETDCVVDANEQIEAPW